jgi:hypothetical protein
VLKQGADNRGPQAQGNLIPAYPEIEAIKLPNNQRAVLLGDQVQIFGHGFAGELNDKSSVTVSVRLQSARWRLEREIPVIAADRSGNEIRFQVPPEPVNLPAGPYSVSVSVMPNGKAAEKRVSKEVDLLIAPRITSAMPAIFAASIVSLTVTPQVRPGQSCSLVLGNESLPAQPITGQGTEEVTFNASALAPGTYRVRLLVDGADSLLVDRSDPKNLQFDPSQQITIA